MLVKNATDHVLILPTDATGRSSTRLDYIQPGLKTRWSTTTTSGATGTASATWINGYAASSVSVTGAKAAQDFDDKGRLSHQYSRYNGSSYDETTTYAYYGDTEYVNTVTTGGITTTYAYGWGTANGAREVAVTDAAGKVSRTAFNAMDQPWRTWGSATSPSENGYDTLGRRTTSKTWRSGDFTGANWPTSAGGDTTSWTLEQATGLLLSKTYADGRQLTYTYKPLGQLATRTNSRSIVTTYNYFDGSTTSTADVSHRTQELRSVTYSDGTPATSYLYKRSGLPSTVVDGTGTRSFVYRSDLQLDSETLPSGFYGAARILKATFDPNASWRATGFQLTNSGTVEASVLATFDPATGRVSTLAGSGTTYTVGYKSYTDWVQTLTSGAYVQTRNLKADRSVVERVSTTWNGALQGDYSGTFDARGLRLTQVLGGAIGGGSTNTYAYNDRGELAASTNSSATATWRNYA